MRHRALVINCVRIDLVSGTKAKGGDIKNTGGGDTIGAESPFSGYCFLLLNIFKKPGGYF